MDINKLKSEIKTKDEDMLMEKLNLDQMLALNTQKITFLENEVKTWKERYDEQSKDLSEIKSEKNILSTDIDKLKTENKNLKNKLNSLSPGDVSNLEKKMNSTINTTSNGFYAGMNRASSKILMELLNEQNSIKDFLAEIKNNTNKIISMNQSIMNNVQILNKDNNNQNNLDENDNKKEIVNNIENSNGNDVEEFKIIENNENNDDKNMSNEFFKTIDNTDKEEKESVINNKDSIDSLKIKIINHVLKKNNSGIPYLDYVCEIKNKEKTKKIHRKLKNFYSLHISLKEFFKDKINIPDKDNFFIEENIKSFSLENKQDILNSYIDELSKNDEIKKSNIFLNFFEIN
jgi:hypothetical protein